MWVETPQNKVDGFCGADSNEECGRCFDAGGDGGSKLLEELLHPDSLSYPDLLRARYSRPAVHHIERLAPAHDSRPHAINLDDVVP